MVTISALHGFLGRPQDFKILGLEHLYAPSFDTLPCTDFFSFAQRFNHATHDDVLLGYSLGARLALHCLVQQKKKYRGAIIMAAHPGLKTDREREERRILDYEWAERFQKQPWAQLMKQWNGQEIFKKTPVIERREQDYNRSVLAKALKIFSLGHQAYLAPQINDLDIPILWLSSQIESPKLEDVRLKHPHSSIIQLPYGHRFLFEQPQIIHKLIKKFLHRL